MWYWIPDQSKSRHNQQSRKTDFMGQSTKIFNSSFSSIEFQLVPFTKTDCLLYSYIQEKTHTKHISLSLLQITLNRRNIAAFVADIFLK